MIQERDAGFEMNEQHFASLQALPLLRVLRLPSISRNVFRLFSTLSASLLFLSLFSFAFMTADASHHHHHCYYLQRPSIVCVIR